MGGGRSSLGDVGGVANWFESSSTLVPVEFYWVKGSLKSSDSREAQP